MKPAQILLSLCGLLLALSVVGCGSPDPAANPDRYAPPLTSVTTPEPHAAAWLAANPTQVDVPSIGAKSSLIPLGLNADHTFNLPDAHHPLQGGWFEVTTKDPQRTPVLVIIGHVDGDQKPGLFFHLRDIKPGAKVTVGMDDGTTRNYSITHLDRVPKTAFPGPAVFAPTPDSEIRLITCGGKLDRQAHSYEDNEVAYGVQN